MDATHTPTPESEHTQAPTATATHAGANGKGSNGTATEGVVDLDQLRQMDKPALVDRVVALSQDKLELERKRFVDNGLSRFTEIMRLRVDSTLESWAENLLLELVPFVNGLQAAVFMLEEPEAADTDSDPEGYLRRIGGYALPEDALERLELNHGLTGQVARTGEPLYYQTPEYFRSHTESSLSKIQAKVLLVQPLIQNDRVEGVLELTAIHDFEAKHLQFIEALAGTVAGHLITLRSQVQIQHLYGEAQERQSQLERKEEEMRQNLQELEATQEQMQIAQAQSAESEARSKQFLSEIPVGIVVVDAEGAPFYANKVAADLLGPGISPDATDEEVGMLYTRKRAGAEQDYPENELPIAKALQGESATSDDLEVIINGKRVQIEVTAAPIYNDAEVLMYAIATYKDITEQKEKEREIHHQNEALASREEEMRQNVEELEATQEQMREVQREVLDQRNIMNSILDSNADAIIAIDNNFRLLSANAAVRENYEGSGLEPKEGELLWNFVPQEQQDYYRDCYTRAMNGERFTEELSYEHDGQTFYFSSAFYPILGQNDDIIGAANQTTDVTHRRRQEEEIKNQSEMLAASEEELRQNMEEMEATVEEMTRAQGELKTREGILNSAALVSETDRKGYITYCNEQFAKVSGYEVEELIGQNHNVVRHPDMPKETFKDLWGTIGRGKIWQGKIKNKTKDGGHYWVQATMAPVLGKDGKPYKYVGVRFEITDMVNLQEEMRQQAEELQAGEEELRQNMEEMEATVEEMTRAQGELKTREGILNSAALVSETDRKGYITYCNEQFAKVSGYEVEELIGQNHNVVRHPDMPKETFKDLWGTIGRGKIWQGKIKNKTKDGGHYWVQATMAPVLGKDGKPYKYVGVRFEITDMVNLQEEMRQQAEELQAGEEELRQSMEEMEATREEVDRIKTELENQDNAIQRSNAVIEFDVDGNIRRANANFLEVVGYNAEEVEGRHHRMFVEPAEAASPEYREFWAKLKRGEYQEGTYKRYRKDGSVVWLRASYNPVMNSDGVPYKVMKFALDVSKQKQQEQVMREQTEEMRAQEEELRQNMEEMEATREEVERVKRELQFQDNAIQRSSAVVEFDLEGNILKANDNFLERMGYKAFEIKNRHHRIFVDSAYAASEEYAEFWERLKRGEFFEDEYKRIDKQGETVWLRASYNPVMNENGVPFKVVEIAMDITEQKQQEQVTQQQAEELQSQEEELRQSVEEMEATMEEMNRAQAELKTRDGLLHKAALVSETDRKGIITYCNEEFASVSGYTVDELIGQNHNIVRHPDMPKEIYKDLWGTIGRGKVWQGKIKNLKKDGGHYWVQATMAPVLGKDGKPVKYIGMRFEITEMVDQQQQLKQASEEMAASEEELRQNMEEMQATQEEVGRLKNEMEHIQHALNRSNAIIEFDIDGHILHANKKFLALMGYALDDIIDEHHQIFVSDREAKSKAYKAFWKKLAEGEFQEGEFRHKDKAGNIVRLKATYNPILDEDGVPYKVIKFATPVKKASTFTDDE